MQYITVIVYAHILSAQNHFSCTHYAKYAAASVIKIVDSCIFIVGITKVASELFNNDFRFEMQYTNLTYKSARIT